ncbi:MAG: ABC transporter permease [Christensenellales bacterium]
MKALRKILQEASYPLIVTAVALALWYAAAAATASEFIVPSPFAAIKRFFGLFAEKAFYAALGSTLARSLISYAVSFITALAFALAAMFSRPVRKLLSPLVSVCRALPTMAVVLLLVIWTGPKAAPVIVALLVVLPTLYASFYEAITGVDKDTVDMARIDGAGKIRLALGFYLPLAAPGASRSAAGALSLTVKLMVAAEVLANTAGSLGAMMQTARIYFETAELMALTVATVLVSLLLEGVVYALLKLTFSDWK